MKISEKVLNIMNVKEQIKTQISRTGQRTNVKFRDYTTLIDNIPNIQPMTDEDINECTLMVININGENA